jgi:hypothetical protein
MLRDGTPLEDHLRDHGLLVKREDLSCPPPGPPFSKTRGVLAHVRARWEAGVRVFGVLDTFHSQAGHAVAAAVSHINGEHGGAPGDPGSARCLNYFPVYAADMAREPQPLAIRCAEEGAWVVPRAPQLRSRELGAQLLPLPAGRSAILFHRARRGTELAGGYMMPNALKLPETVEQTAAEVCRTYDGADLVTQRRLEGLPWLIAASSGTIAAGVIVGLQRRQIRVPVVIHMGYDRSEEALKDYLLKCGVNPDMHLRVVNEGYAYRDQARPGPTPPWPCNPWYDLKAYRWWQAVGRGLYNSHAVMWNVG